MPKLLPAAGRVAMAVTAILIGLYPLIYYLADMHNEGLMATKTEALKADPVWHTVFYIHISFGGIALLTGWTQFISKWRNKYLGRHRTVGNIYLLSVLFSSVAGLYIACFASAGPVSKVGFGLLAICWFFTGLKAYTTIRRKDIIQHQNWMIRNYALAFAAVTLRIYLPLLANFVFHAFDPAYRIVAWLCWLPNLLVAEVIIRKNRKVLALRASANSQ